MSPSAYFVCGILLVVMVTTAHALKCYECGNVLDDKCGVTWGYGSEDEAKLHVVTCSDDATACRKLISPYDVNKMLVGRSCWNITNAESWTPNKCYKADDDTESCYCTGDLCNGDNSLKALTGVTALCSILVALLVL